MKADTLTAISNTPKRSSRSTNVKRISANQEAPLPGKGPWVRVDGVWYTKDAGGEWVAMSS